MEALKIGFNPVLLNGEKKTRRAGKPKKQARGRGRIYQAYEGGYYYFDFIAPDGRRVRQRASMDKSVAVFMLEQARTEAEKIAAGMMAPEPEPAPPVIGAVEWLDSWKERRKVLVRPKTWYSGDRTHVGIFKAWIEEAEDVGTLADIDAALLNRFKAFRLTHVSKGSAAHSFRVLAKCFEDAVTEGHIPENPVRKLDKIKPPQTTKRALSDEEVDKLLAVAKSKIRAIIAVGALAGLRREEIISLDWQDIDFEQGFILVRNKAAEDIETKSGRNRDVPISPMLEKLLKEWKAVSAGEIVFPSETGNSRMDGARIYRQFKAVVKIAKIDRPKEVNVHSLRHTFVTRALNSGAPVVAVQAAAGHVNVTTTMRYCHATREGVRAGMAKSWR